jgi:diguanylate cyclase (GGDEF)-like protein
MPPTAQPELTFDEAGRPAPKQRGTLIRLAPPLGDQPALHAWALAVAEAADRRVAELEARLDFLRDLAVTDELTGAMNRRGFMMEFGRAIDAARRGGPQGVVIICDLDGFKAVNDRLGHARGDDVLREVGRLLMRGVRKMDVAARLGGDEFGLLLIGAEETGALRRIQAFARAIATIAPAANGLALPLSASFGLARFDGSEDEETVLHRADMAMYEEKRRPPRLRRCQGRRRPLQAVG